MEQIKINHSPLITAIEKFVEDTIDRQRPWRDYWYELVELLQELQVQYNQDLIYSAYNQAMINFMLELEQIETVFQYIRQSTLQSLSFRDVKSRFEKFKKKHEDEVKKFKEDELNSRIKAIEYTELLLEHYSKLEIIRVDLAYKCDMRTRIDISDFRENIRKLLDRMQDKDKHFKNLHGYIYALEQGCEKGYHAHFIFFFDGSRVQSDRYIADCIIATWNEITHYEGIGFNCNTKINRDSYKATGNDALGRVNRNDFEKRDNILKVVRYFTEPTKTEQYLRIRCKNMQSFGHGKFNTELRRGANKTFERVRYRYSDQGIKYNEDMY